MEDLQEEFECIQNKIENEGLGYYLLDYAVSDSMPDDKSKKLFEKAVKALSNFKKYIDEQSQ